MFVLSWTASDETALTVPLTHQSTFTTLPLMLSTSVWGWVQVCMWAWQLLLQARCLPVLTLPLWHSHFPDHILVFRAWKSEGWQLDANGYTTSFRVMVKGKSQEQMQAAIQAAPKELQSTFNCEFVFNVPLFIDFRFEVMGPSHKGGWKMSKFAGILAINKDLSIKGSSSVTFLWMFS